MKPKHTPGPWFCDLETHGPLYIKSDYADIARICDDSHPTIAEQNANAQLIASAPELLHVMILVRNYLAEIQTVNFHAGHKIALDSMNEVIDKAQAPG